MNELMNSCLAGLNDVGRVFCNYSANMFVQSGVLIILLLVIDLLMRKRVRATFRYWIWMLVFVKLILPPSLSMPTGIGYWRGDILSVAPPALEEIFTNTRHELSEPPLLIDETPLLFEIPQNQLHQTTAELTGSATPVVSYMNTLTWQAVVFALWLVGVLIFSAILVQRMFYVRQLIAQSEVAGNRFTGILNQYREQINVRRPIELRLSNNVSSPAVCELFKPVILIPTTLIEKLPPDRFKTVLIHELCHIKRGDLWINSAQTILQIIYFYNPLVWLANMVIRRIREQAVDEMVLVALGTEAKSYGNTLIDIAEMAFFKTSLSLRLIGVVESKKALHGRIRHMLNRPIPKSAKVGVLGTIVIMVIAVVFLPMAKAQKKNLPKQEKIQVNAQKSNRFEATLSNGVTVELAGVCEHPSAGKQWWRPDGTLMDTHQFRDYDYDDALTVKEDEYARLLALKFDDDVVHDIQISSSLEDSRGRRFAPDYSDRKRRIRRPIQVILAAFRETTESTNLRLGIAAEPWKTVSAGTHGRSVAYARDSIAQRAIIYSEAIEKNGRICITATHLVDAGYDCRIYARGKGGEVYEPLKYSNGGGGTEMHLCKSEFDIPLEKIGWFHLQARPFQWVTFKNISLQPGKETDVQIEVEQPDALRVPSAKYPTLGSAVDAATEGDTIVADVSATKDFMSEQNKSYIILQANVFMMKTSLSSIHEFLQNQLGLQPLMGELSDTQAERFRQWAASVPGSDIFTGPRSLVFDGHSSKISMTNLTEYILDYVKDANSPSGYEPKSHDIKTGIEIEFTPFLNDDNKQIRLSLNIEKLDAIDIVKKKHKSDNEVQLPVITRRKVSTQATIPVGKYSLIIPSGFNAILHFDGNRLPVEPEELTILLIKAEVKSKAD